MAIARPSSTSCRSCSIGDGPVTGPTLKRTLPSGLHDGAPMLPPEAAIRRSVPSSVTAYTPGEPLRVETNAISRPVGDQLGKKSFPAFVVIWRTAPLARSSTQMS